MKIFFIITGVFLFNISYANKLSVTQFGANGKDIKDDTAAFQKCADALSNLGGGTMEIPKGTYYISHVKFFGKKYSNINIQGNNSKINQVFPRNRVSVENGKWMTFAERKGADGCFVFDAEVNYQTDDNLSIKNISINDLQFYSNVPINKFDELLHQISAHGVSNFTVNNCKFIGFLGDGIAINASLDYKKNRNAYNKDITITNCDFDGINKDNRQGISIYYSDGFRIENCNFKNITRTDMPGAIDIEPNDDLQVVRNGSIINCSFENIGGLGAICFVLEKSTVKNKFSNKNFTVDNCRFLNVVSPITVIGKEDYATNKELHQIVFKNSTVQNSQAVANIISASGVLFYNIKYKNVTSANLNVVTDIGSRDISFENCLFDGVKNNAGLGFFGSTYSINFLNCLFYNFAQNAITINDNKGVGKISGNKFMSTKTKNGLPIVTSQYEREFINKETVVLNNKSYNNFAPLNLNVFKK